jgi:hypothetical protein
MTGQKAKRILRHPLAQSSLVLLLILVVAGGVIGHETAALDEESKAFVDHAVPAIASNWSPEQLLARVSPAEHADLKPEDLQALADLRSKLGRSETYLGATGGLNRPYLGWFGGPTSASYADKVIFANGIVTFNVTVARLDGRWMIDAYHIDVSYFGPPGRGLL